MMALWQVLISTLLLSHRHFMGYQKFCTKISMDLGQVNTTTPPLLPGGFRSIRQLLLIFYATPPLQNNTLP